MNDYELWLSSIPLNYNTKIKLINMYTCAENLWYHVINKIYSEILTEKLVARLINSWDKEKIENIKKSLDKNNIKIITYSENKYPNRLKAIEDAPYMLFYLGDIDLINETKTVSIVGSRNCSYYGNDVTKLMVSDLCKNNISIVSGMAKGIDSIAHRSCLDKGGYTCAVLGCGVDVIYPKENVKLYKEISEKGCILSEFIPGTPPTSYNFPLRNRIISALSDIVIVIEASLRSGSLITAGRALDQGKDVIAVPGSIFSEQSKGSNKLIKDGAYPFTELRDIYELLGETYKTNDNSIEIQQNSKYENKIYSVVKNSPIHIDDILRITNIDIKLLYEVLFEMQLKEKIRCLAGNYYVRINSSI
jgi:DNA processing protein